MDVASGANPFPFGLILIDRWNLEKVGVGLRALAAIVSLPMTVIQAARGELTLHRGSRGRETISLALGKAVYHFLFNSNGQLTSSGICSPPNTLKHRQKGGGEGGEWRD
jgi:hypothetical protein